MLRLRGRIQHYDWGSNTALPAFTRSRPDGKPWAEIWYGSHHSSPSVVSEASPWFDGGGTVEALAPRPLDEYLDQQPRGPEGEGRSTLPFLAKLLAASRALSLQVHPSREVADRRFREQVAAGEPKSQWLYSDNMHKPETLLALVPTTALVGFRDHSAIRSDLEALDVASLRAIAELLGPQPEDLKRAFERALRLPGDQLEDALRRISEHQPSGPRGSAASVDDWLKAGRAPQYVEDLSSAADDAGADTGRAFGILDSVDTAKLLLDQYPGDVGVVGSLFLNAIELAPGQALSLGAGVVHGYMSGGGLEVMACSDNVLRAGLTSKRVAIDELLDVVDFRVAPPLVDSPAVTRVGSADSGWTVLDYPAHFAEYTTKCFQVNGFPESLTVGGAEPGLVIGLAGSVVVESGDGRMSLAPGDAAFLSGGEIVTLEAEQGAVAYITTPRA